MQREGQGLDVHTRRQGGEAEGGRGEAAGVRLFRVGGGARAAAAAAAAASAAASLHRRWPESERQRHILHGDTGVLREGIRG